MASAPSNTAWRDVRHLRAGRQRRGDHRFEHLGRHHDRLALQPGAAGDALLQARHLFQGQFHAKVAARHHQPVGNGDDLVEAGDGLRFLDLRHHECAPGDHGLHLRHVIGPLDERSGDPIDADLQRRQEVGVVLGCHGGDRDLRVGQADALARGDWAADLDHGGRVPLVGLGNVEAHAAVVDQYDMAGAQRPEDLGMGQAARASRPPGRDRSSSAKRGTRLQRNATACRKCRSAAWGPAGRRARRSAGRRPAPPRGWPRRSRAARHGSYGSC